MSIFYSICLSVIIVISFLSSDKDSIAASGDGCPKRDVLQHCAAISVFVGAGFYSIWLGVVYSIQPKFAYKQGIDSGFTTDILELTTRLPDGWALNNIVDLVWWGVGAVVFTIMLSNAVNYLVSICLESFCVNADSDSVKFKKETNITNFIMVFLFILALGINSGQKVVDHQRHASYDMTNSIDVSDSLVAAISKQCKGVNVASITGGEIYCGDASEDFYYKFKQSVDFKLKDIEHSNELFMQSGFYSRKERDIFFLLTWESKNTKDRKLYFMVAKDLAPPERTPAQVTLWAERYLDNFNKLIAEMRAEELLGGIDGHGWSRLKVELSS